MYGLNVVENGLVPIYADQQDRVVVNARDLYEFLGSNRQFANWIKDRLDKYGFTDGEDYTSFNEIVKRGNGGSTTRMEYLLTLDVAKEIAMFENNERGRQVRRYFIECERRLREKDDHMYRCGVRKDVLYWQKRSEAACTLTNVMHEYADVLGDVEVIQLTSCINHLLVCGEKPHAELYKLYSAGELGKMFGVSAYVIGTIAGKADIKNNDYGAWVPNTYSNSPGKPCIFKYNEAGKEYLRKLIEQGEAGEGNELSE